MGAENGLAALGGSVQKIIDLGGSAIVRHHRESVVVHVEDQILAHHGQTDQSDICCWFHENSTLVGGNPDVTVPYNTHHASSQSIGLRRPIDGAPVE
jgi:hypothetical protein